VIGFILVPLKSLLPMDEKKSLKDLLAVKKEVGETDDKGIKALMSEEEKALDGFIEATKEKPR